MTLLESIYAKLSNAASATYALVGTRIYPIEGPQAVQTTGDFVVYQQIASSAAETHDDAQGLDETIIQFTAYASTIKAAEAIRRALRADLLAAGALTGIKVTSPMERHRFESEIPLKGADLDLRFFHVPTAA